MVRVDLGRVPIAVIMKLFFSHTQGLIGHFKAEGASDFPSDELLNVLGCRNCIFDDGSLIPELRFKHPSIHCQ